MEKESFKSSLPVQIRFSDIDALGHINNNIYLSYFDLGKAGYFEDLRGYALNWLEGSIVVAHLEMDFLSPIFYREKVVVQNKIVRLGDKSGNFQQRIINSETKEIKCTSNSVFVYYDAATAKSVSIPQPWREAISKFEGKEL